MIYYIVADIKHEVAFCSVPLQNGAVATGSAGSDLPEEFDGNVNAVFACSTSR